MVNRFVGALIATLLSTHAVAGSKINITGGASPIEGGAGGGLSPWALISGYGSSREWGGSAFGTRVVVDDFDLTAYGIAVSYGDRFEASVTRQVFDVDPLDLRLKQDIFGAKVRLAGTLLYSGMPQVSLGIQHKRQRDFDVPELLGAEDRSGTDVYLTAGKVFFAALADRNIMVNGTLRYTDANETGLLGFGGPNNSAEVVAEGSVVLFLNDRWVLGYDYRQKPDLLDSISEHDWQDVFVGYFPNKRMSIVAAYVDLDEIAGQADQTGLYLSAQLTF